jgi:hypothetical protein
VKPRGNWRRNILIGVGVLVGLGIIGSLTGGDPSSSPSPTSPNLGGVSTPRATAIASLTERPSVDAAPSEGTPSEVASVDPDLAYEIYKQAFQSTALELFKTDVADAIEADFFWVDSIDRTTYDATRNMLKYEATIDYEAVYNNDLQEWKSDTWELFSTFARDLWVPYMEGFGEETVTTDWPRWTPRLRLQGNDGRLVVDCPGRLMHAISQREATQTEFSKDCTFKPE